MFPNCFQLYFHDITIYIRRVVDFAIIEWPASFIALLLSIGATTADMVYETNIFGVSNFLLLIVMGTVAIDAYYGIRISILGSQRALQKAGRYEEGTPEHKKFMKTHELLRFSPVKLQFTFFKCFTLMGYLYFANALLESTGDGLIVEVLDFTVEVLCRVPVAIFWYYEFKSIGRNSSEIYGKKAPIFHIAEWIFEPRIKQFFSRDPKSPQDE
jgi:hypothetical protein